jgi:hypothetical protein
MHITMVQPYSNFCELFKGYDLSKVVNSNELASNFYASRRSALCMCMYRDGADYIHELLMVSTMARVHEACT